MVTENENEKIECYNRSFFDVNMMLNYRMLTRSQKCGPSIAPSSYRTADKTPVPAEDDTRR